MRQKVISIGAILCGVAMLPCVACAQPAGSVVAWGDNSKGQCNLPSPNQDFMAVSAGGEHSLGLKMDGSIVGWGSNQYGQCDVPSPNADFVAIAAGGNHSLGLKADGSIVAWGSNEYGQCEAPSPNSGFKAIAAGRNHCLGLQVNGSVVAWGNNDEDQCTVPAPNSGIMAIAAGGDSSVSIRTNGGINHWGYSGEEEQEDGSGHAFWWDALGMNTLRRYENGDSDIIAVATGALQVVGLHRDGSIEGGGNWWDSFFFCRGYMCEDGEFFNWIAGGHLPSFDYVPNQDFVAVAGWSDFKPNYRYQGVYATIFGLKSDGSLVAWGDNVYGLGDLPEPNAEFMAIAAGGRHCLAIRAACSGNTAGDTDWDCGVDREDLMQLAAAWLSGGCAEPLWCDRADITRDGRVGIEDLAVMAENWMR